MSLPRLWIDWLVAQATPQGLRLSLVGGAVRDQWLGHPTPLKDLDVVVEGPLPWPALRLAKAIAAAAGALPAGHQLQHWQTHGAYGTARLELLTPQGPLLCDLTSARRETYAFPGAHPQVVPAALGDDLSRRDFSLNAMALRLPEGTADLLDPHGGAADLAAGQLQLLHGQSLYDDPTRLLRAVRYGARLGLELAPATAQQAQQALGAWPWPPGAPALGARLRMELELLFEEHCWRQALGVLEGWGGLGLLQRGWRHLPVGSGRRLARLGHWGAALDPAWSAPELRLVGLLELLPGDLSVRLELAQRLQLHHRQQRLLEQAGLLLQWLQQGEARAHWRPSQWTEALEHPGSHGHPLAVLLLLLHPEAPGAPWRRPLLHWLLRWRQLRSPLSAKQLLAEGLPPGPALGQRLWQERAAALDRGV
ncbi:MAG: tRNA nucleotidyltransferase/poly(A) polymerase [Cyanobacteriota bacterium]|jgi:poly(A) polymerase